MRFVGTDKQNTIKRHNYWGLRFFESVPNLSQPFPVVIPDEIGLLRAQQLGVPKLYLDADAYVQMYVIKSWMS